MFHDTPVAKSLMKYLVTAEAQDIWVKIGGALSANKNAKSYPDDISKRSAEVLAGAKTFVFDASDSMPTAMNDGFWKAMVALTNGSKSVDQVLADLDTVQKDAYTT
jgi:alpha-glucoside transport system substrate-binding protein